MLLFSNLNRQFNGTVLEIRIVGYGMAVRRMMPGVYGTSYSRSADLQNSVYGDVSIVLASDTTPSKHHRYMAVDSKWRPTRDWDWEPLSLVPIGNYLD